MDIDIKELSGLYFELVNKIVDMKRSIFEELDILKSQKESVNSHELTRLFNENYNVSTHIIEQIFKAEKLISKYVEKRLDELNLFSENQQDIRKKTIDFFTNIDNLKNLDETQRKHLYLEYKIAESSMKQSIDIEQLNAFIVLSGNYILMASFFLSICNFYNALVLDYFNQNKQIKNSIKEIGNQVLNLIPIVSESKELVDFAKNLASVSNAFDTEVVKNGYIDDLDNRLLKIEIQNNLLKTIYINNIDFIDSLERIVNESKNQVDETMCS